MEGSRQPPAGESGLDRAWERLRGAWQWPRAGSRRRRFAILAFALGMIVGAAIVVADQYWRDELPRSTIAAVSLGLVILVTLWLFGSSGSKAALGLIGAIGAILVTAGTALDLDKKLPDGPAPKGALVDCHGTPSGYPDGFAASTDLGYTLVRQEPRFDSGVLRRYPPGCELAFDGYCIGDPKADWRFHVPDPVWFSLAREDGFVASADIRARPAGGSVPVLDDCQGGRPAPAQPEITDPIAETVQGPLEFTAAAPRAIEVGFAVYYPEAAGDPSSARWHPLGVDLNTADGISAEWDSRSVPGQSGPNPARIAVLAVPCEGLEFPYGRPAERRYVVANHGGRPPPPLKHVRRLDHGAALACENVQR